MKKIITIIIVVIIIAGVGYWIYPYLNPTPTSEEKDEETEDEIVNLLGNLKNETGIGFSEIKEVEFKWVVKVDPKIAEETVTGKGFEVEGITSAQYEKVEAFFKDKGFEVDIYNVSAGTISESTGYKKDLTVCTVAAGASGYETGQWILSEQDVEVRCGEGGSEIIPLISKEEAIQELFAEKYKTKASAISVNISRETETHAKGTIKVLDSLAEGGAGEKGIFLAAKVNNEWGLVEKEVEKYNFSEDTAIETRNGDDFFVVLDSNPTTGYGWQLDFDSSFIQLVDRKYVSRSQEALPVPGAGGDEAFNFLALKSGKTEITFSYLREWEDKAPINTKVFEITIE